MKIYVIIKEAITYEDSRPILVVAKDNEKDAKEFVDQKNAQNEVVKAEINKAQIEMREWQKANYPQRGHRDYKQLMLKYLQDNTDMVNNIYLKYGLTIEVRNEAEYLWSYEEVSLE